MNKPLVSVCMITYNHEKYIAEAIQGVLMQKTDFEIEFIIANDASTDNTHALITEFAIDKKNITINYINHSVNSGMMSNFVSALQQCSGKYIALCEGDDYWSDPLKLQKQVDFMEANPGYGICFHNVSQVNEFSKKAHIIPCVKEDRDFTLNDYVLNNKTATCSILFRNNALDNSIPEWFSKLPFGDLGIILMVLKKYNGKGRVLKDTMGVYRIHQEGIHGSFHKNNKGLIKAYKQHLLFTKIIEHNLLFETKYKNILCKKKILTTEKLSTLNKQENHQISYFGYRILILYYKVLFKFFL